MTCLSIVISIETVTYNLAGKTQKQILSEVTRDGNYYRFYDEFIKQNKIKVVKTKEKTHGACVYSVTIKNRFIGTVYRRSSEKWINSIELNSRPGFWTMRGAVLGLVFYDMGIPLGEKVSNGRYVKEHRDRHYVDEDDIDWLDDEE